MKPCPHCKLPNQGFVVKEFMAGPADSYYDKDGEYSELNMDKAYWSHQSTVVRCANCGKIRRDVYLLDRITILEKE
jgi:hypothetical protein